MFLRAGLLALAIGTLVACASPTDDREWMKVNEKYSGDDFRRDVKACSKAGVLDDTCMRARGWVDVSRNKPDTGPFPEQKPQMSTTPRR